MARPRTVDREQLLVLAEGLVASSGAAALSFGSLAQAAGLSKATVQSIFVTREGLIEAILERWLQQEQARFDLRAGPAPSPRERLRAHIQTTVTETAEANGRFAALLAALTGSGQQADSVARWYASRAGDFNAVSPEERRRRITFLAAEGAFFVRHLVGIPMTHALWQEIFQDLMDHESGTL